MNKRIVDVEVTVLGCIIDSNDCSTVVLVSRTTAVHTGCLCDAVRTVAQVRATESLLYTLKLLTPLPVHHHSSSHGKI
jgi:hypothetical protein